MVTKRPRRNVAAGTGKATAKLMDNQDTATKGDSRAERTARTSFSTTPEILDQLTEEAYKRRMPRSQLIEECIVAHLGL